MNTRYNDLEVEALRYLKHNPHAASQVHLPFECMLHPDTRRALEQIKSCHDSNIPPTPIILQARGIPEPLIQAIKKEPQGTTPIVEYARLLRERYAKYSADRRITDEVLPALRNGVSAQSALKKIIDIYDYSQQYIVPPDMGQTLDESMHNYNERIKGTRKPTNEVRLRLPFPRLRKRMPSIKPDTGLAIAAYSSNGKSTLADMCMEAWAQEGQNGLLLDSELFEHTVSQRRVMRWSGVSVIDQDTEEENPGQHLNDQQRQAIERATALIASWPGSIQHVQVSGWSMDQMFAMIALLNDRRPWKKKNNKPISYVVFDYLNRLAPGESDPQSKADLYDIFILRFHALAVKMNFVPIILAQFDKVSGNKPFPMLTDIKYGGTSMAQYNKHGLIIDRNIDEESGEIRPGGRIRLAKESNGKQGPVPVIFNEEYLRFEEVIK